jgi:FkbH-like protein
VTELTLKTNQFNLTTRRYTESELAAISADEGCRVYWLKLEDRFGPNGIVGVLILRRESREQWLIDTFLLSCRVIGRTVEEALLGYAMREMKELGATVLTGEYIPTGKNGMVANLYGKLGFAQTDSNEKRTLWTLDLNQKSIEVPVWFEIADRERISAQ